MSSSFNPSIQIHTWTLGNDHTVVPWEQLAQWDKEDFPWPWQKDDWLNLAHGPRRYLLQWLPQAGFALWELDNKPHAYLLKVLIRPAWRGKGLAQELLGAGQQWLQHTEFSTALLEVACTNLAAIALYQAQGWSTLRCVKKFYADGSDAFSMQKLFI